MENEYTELIIGYLQGSLSKKETDLFYNWVNESVSNKKMYFEIKAMYDAGNTFGETFDAGESWQRLLDKKGNTQALRFTLCSIHLVRLMMVCTPNIQEVTAWKPTW